MNPEPGRPTAPLAGEQRIRTPNRFNLLPPPRAGKILLNHRTPPHLLNPGQGLQNPPPFLQEHPFALHLPYRLMLDLYNIIAGKIKKIKSKGD